MPKTLKIEFQYGTWIPVITFLLYDISIAILVAQSSFYSNSHKAKEQTFKTPQMIEKKSIKNWTSHYCQVVGVREATQKGQRVD